MTAKVRPARPRDIDVLGILRSGQYWVMEDDQGVAAWGGIEAGAPPLAVMWTAQRALLYPVGIARTCLKVRSIISQMGGNVYAFQDQSKATAGKFLAWMGFEPVEQLPDGRVLHKWIG